VALCEKVVGLPALARDPLYATAAARALNRDSLLAVLGAAFRKNTRRHWMEACLRHGVPAGDVKSVPEAFESPTVKARQVVQTLNSDHLGPVSLVRPAQGLAAQRTASYKAPPMLGEDTAAILSGTLGYDPTEIEALTRSGVVRQFVQAPRAT